MKFFRDIVVPILAGLAIFALFQATIGSFKVYGSSMLPTIEEGEYIMVSKAAYFFGEPHRGDIIVFISPQDPKSDLIKRIIALPGDTVEIKDNTVFVNGNALAESSYTLEPPHYIMLPEEIPAAHYFVLGDNRNNSSDSHRGWTVPRGNIVGKSWITYWPPYRWRFIKHHMFNLATQATEAIKSTLAMKTACPTR